MRKHSPPATARKMITAYVRKTRVMPSPLQTTHMSFMPSRRVLDMSAVSRCQKLAARLCAGNMAKQKFEDLLSRIKDTRRMDAVRYRIKRSLPTAAEMQGSALSLLMSQRILFLLPVKGGGGGAHSVVQEVMAARRLGVDAKVAVKAEHRDHFCRQYSDIPEAAQIFVGFSSTSSLVNDAFDYDVVVATIFHSVELLKSITDSWPWILPAYYVQDYEPLFFEEGSENWQIARNSYGRIPNAVLFAKTDWIREQVERNHGVKVHKVLPSIDHEVYKTSATATGQQQDLYHGHDTSQDSPAWRASNHAAIKASERSLFRQDFDQYLWVR